MCPDDVGDTDDSTSLPGPEDIRERLLELGPAGVMLAAVQSVLWYPKLLLRDRASYSLFYALSSAELKGSKRE